MKLQPVTIVSDGSFPLALATIFCVLVSSVEAIQLSVVSEEVVTRTTPANNGAGPLWCYGSPLIVRTGDTVYVSTIETGEGVPPLCNTRWQIWQRKGRKWQLLAQEPEYRQREPCPLVVLGGSRLFLSANPSTRPPGTQYGPCRPTVFGILTKPAEARATAELPVWEGKPNFTDHSYRGLAADGQRGELLLLHIDASTSEQFVSYRDQAGTWHAKGKIAFPIRAAYPQVALRNGQAHVMAIGDIREPVAAWRKLKYEKLKRDWDYVFRRLFYTFNADLSRQSFVEPIEIDTVEKTGGHIANLDLHIDSDGAAHALYLKRPHVYDFIRDAYFPGQPMTTSLQYALIRDGRVMRRRVLASTPSSGAGFEPGYARFHEAPDERLFVVMAGSRIGEAGTGRWSNQLLGIRPETEAMEVELEHPFRTFFTNSPRGGSLPSHSLDLFGIADDGPNLRYAEVRLQP